MVVENDTHIFFWMPDSFMSNWYSPSPLYLIDHPSVRFENSEAAFMFLKAMTFGDLFVAKQVIANQDPKYTKGLGKTVNGFTDEVWAEERYNCMLDACFAKFTQNPKLAKKLLATGSKILVEASPYDKIWGVGLAPNDVRVLNPANWRGLNLLGEVLMDIRDLLNLMKEKRHGHLGIPG